MFTNLKSIREMHIVALASKPLCADYWIGFSTQGNNEQDPINMASFYKGSGNKM